FNAGHCGITGFSFYSYDDSIRANALRQKIHDSYRPTPKIDSPEARLDRSDRASIAHVVRGCVLERSVFLAPWGFLRRAHMEQITTAWTALQKLSLNRDLGPAAYLKMCHLDLWRQIPRSRFAEPRISTMGHVRYGPEAYSCTAANSISIRSRRRHATAAPAER